jgi:hypothetical protein
MTAIPVRIRLADDSESVPLCTADVSELEALMKEIPRWGIYQTKDSLLNSGDDLMGQFVIDRSAAYFEIVVDSGDAS